jgi:hypothetical protein
MLDGDVTSGKHKSTLRFGPQVEDEDIDNIKESFESTHTQCRNEFSSYLHSIFSPFLECGYASVCVRRNDGTPSPSPVSISAVCWSLDASQNKGKP